MADFDRFLPRIQQTTCLKTANSEVQAQLKNNVASPMPNQTPGLFLKQFVSGNNANKSMLHECCCLPVFHLSCSMGTDAFEKMSEMPVA